MSASTHSRRWSIELVLIVLCGLLVSGPGTAQDALPTGAVSFFGLERCPAGWAPFTKADGFTILPVIPLA